MRTVIALLLVACSSSHKAAGDAAPVAKTAPIVAHTPQQFLTAGTPTFVIGAVDPMTERMMRAQAGLIQPNFAGSQIVTDVHAGWPAHPVVYGAPHVNASLAGVQLPFVIAPGHLEIAGQRFDGDDIRLITVVPAGADHPEMLLYAGTGNPGIAEINAIPLADTPIEIADRFGVLVTGTWLPDGSAKLDPPHRRVDWRTVTKDVAGTPVNIHYVGFLPPTPGEPAEIDAITSGVQRSLTALALPAQPALEIYVYPDPRSKEELAGDKGAGTADVEARTFHVISVRPEDMANLIAHEATHLLAYRTWGPAGTPLLGEGLAVWAAGEYAGKTLDQWKAALAQPPTIAQALTRGRALGEPVLYPFGGLLVRYLVATYGAAAVKDHFLAATAATWADACKAVGTTPDALEQAFDAAIHGSGDDCDRLLAHLIEIEGATSAAELADYAAKNGFLATCRKTSPKVIACALAAKTQVAITACDSAGP